MASLATNLMLGKRISELNLKQRLIPHFGVKEAVFPFKMFPEVDPLLGPEMRSTGEVLGMADTFGMAFYKAQEATGTSLPTKGAVLITVNDRDKNSMLESARIFAELGFKIFATKGTCAFLTKNNIQATYINKIGYGRPDIVDAIKNVEIQLVVNTPSGKETEEKDSYIRQSAITYQIPYITTTAAALAAARGIARRLKGDSVLKSLHEYHEDIGR